MVIIHEWREWWNRFRENRSLRDPSPGGGRRLYTVHYIPVRARTWEDSVTKWVHHQGRNNETAPVEKFLLNCLLGIQIDGRSKVKHGETESFGSLV